MKLEKTFRNLVKIENIEWCSIMKVLTSMKNRFAKKIFRSIYKAIPRLFAPCPYIGLIDVWNIKVADDLYSALPAGAYNNKFTIKDLNQKCQLIVDFYANIEK